MKQLIFIVVLFSFLAGGLADFAHAAVPDFVCAHQSSGSVDEVEANCSDGSNQNQGNFDQCQDCCCHHAHAMIKIIPNATANLNFNGNVAFILNETQRSRSLSPLYRPPIA